MTLGADMPENRESDIPDNQVDEESKEQIKKEDFWGAPKRQDFEDQLRCVKQMRIGRRFVVVFVGGEDFDWIPEQEFVVAKAAYQDEETKQWRVDVRWVKPKNRDVHTVHWLSLRDLNFLPYEKNDQWNEFNYVRVSEMFGKHSTEALGANCPCSSYHSTQEAGTLQK